VLAKLETAFFKMVNDQGRVAGRKINFIFQPGYQTEAQIYAEYILKEKSR
jgi:hypothetical protein